nr:PREDICTED: uncharacterized protein LOC109044310 [Bemisia tabaci]
MGTTQVPIQVPNSTRGIGFAISHYFYQSSFINKIIYGNVNIYTFYRVYLALFETRMRQLNLEKALSDRFIGQTPLRSADLINIVFSLTSAPEYGQQYGVNYFDISSPV